MTASSDEQRARMVVELWPIRAVHAGACVRDLLAELNAVRAEEREYAAVIAENLSDEIGATIAAAIRARKENK